jgi:hypothetical protein
MELQERDTHRKALRLNLDPSVYGSIAEIGAGQEVARWLFHVGGASGMVAKSISAYDMKFSDDIYGSTDRYVSRQRLEAMMNLEYEQLLGRLTESRGSSTSFFTFANTVAARNYAGTNICHGWIGLRFQSEPGKDPNDVIMHVSLGDDTNLLQQKAVGILGINLLYGVFYERTPFKSFLKGLMDGLSLDRIEVDFLNLSGPEFKDVDPLLLGLELIRQGLTPAVMITPERTIVEPLQILYKRQIIVERGSFKDTDHIYVELLDAATKRLAGGHHSSKREPVPLFEMTINNLLLEKRPQDSEFLDRMDRLLETGYNIMVSSFPETYHVSAYLIRYTQEPIRFAMGVSSLVQFFQETYYEKLEGGIIEAIGRLIARNVKIYAFPMPLKSFKSYLEACDLDLSFWEVPKSGNVTVENIRPRSHLRHLYQYMLETDAFVDMA